MKITQVRTLAIERLDDLLGRATATQLVEVVEALIEVVGD